MGSSGRAGHGAKAAGEPGTTTGIAFVVLTVLMVWGASAVVLHQMLHVRWGVSLGAAPALFMVALVLRNALHFRRRRRAHPQRES
jgi:hypothetical protein